MGDLYVMREVHENQAGLTGIVALLKGCIWILAERRFAETAHDAEPIDRRMTVADVERLGIIDAACKRRRIARVLL